MNRSLSITLIAIAQAMISSLSLVTGVFLVLLLTGQVEVFSADLTRLPLYFKGLVLLGWFISLWGIVATVGLWTLRTWGWLGSLVFHGLCLVNNGLALVGGQPLSFGVIFSACLSGSLLFSLLLPGVRQPFLNSEPVSS